MPVLLICVALEFPLSTRGRKKERRETGPALYYFHFKGTMIIHGITYTAGFRNTYNNNEEKWSAI